MKWNIALIAILLLIAMTACTQESSSSTTDSEINTELDSNNFSNNEIKSRENEVKYPIEVDRREQREHYGYWIYEMSYELYYEPNKNGYTFNIIQVYGIEDSILQSTINETLKKFFQGLEGNFNEPRSIMANPPMVHLQSERYLSVAYFFEYFSNKQSLATWNLCFTVDMHTGEEVYLDDLIDLNDDFMKLMQSGKILNAEEGRGLSLEERTKQINDLISNDDINSIYGNFSCYTSERYLNFDLWEIDKYMRRDFFYIKNGSIVLKLSGGDTASIKLDDIKLFLKVPKW